MQLVTHNTLIDSILSSYKEVLGKDFEKYKGHCFRMYNYLLQMDINEKEQQLLEVALPFHDLAIWTNGTLDYLLPSYQMAKKYVIDNKLDIDTALMEVVMNNHHKISSDKQTPLAEKMRRADMIDLTFGMMRFGIPKSTIKEIVEAIPNIGFQAMITSKVIAYAVTHPWNPFPMMKI